MNGTNFVSAPPNRVRASPTTLEGNAPQRRETSCTTGTNSLDISHHIHSFSSKKLVSEEDPSPSFRSSNSDLAPPDLLINIMPHISHPCMQSVSPDTSVDAQSSASHTIPARGALRLNKFVRRLHDMLVEERGKCIVEWRKGLLVLHNTDLFSKELLPKYFNTRNFKTFRRQLNYYGFVHVRSFSTTGAATTALWVNQDLARKGSEQISSVLLLKRVNPCPDAKTTEGRRVRKEEAFHSIGDIGMAASAESISFIHNINRIGGDAHEDLSPLVTSSKASLSMGETQNGLPSGSMSSTEVCSGTSSDVAAKLLLMLSHSVPIMT